MKLDGLLRKLTVQIVRACDPERLVLFGSYAKGKENADSDLDILIIGDFHASSFFLRQELQQLVVDYPIRIDIHLVTPREVEAELKKPFGFLASILASGKNLYVRCKSVTSSEGEGHLTSF